MTTGARRVLISAIKEVYCDYTLEELEKLEDDKLLKLFIKAFKIELPKGEQ